MPITLRNSPQQPRYQSRFCCGKSSTAPAIYTGIVEVFRTMASMVWRKAIGQFKELWKLFLFILSSNPRNALEVSITYQGDSI